MKAAGGEGLHWLSCCGRVCVCIAPPVRTRKDSTACVGGQVEGAALLGVAA
jgi:hypothetical protein